MATRGHVTQDPTGDLSTREGTNDLITYLVVRFILVLVVVMLAESFVVWVESLALPALQGALGAGDDAASPTTSLLALVGGIIELIWHVARGDSPQATGGTRSTLTVLLLLMLVLLLVPPLLGALAFSRLVVRKVRGLQERRELELAQADSRRSQFLTDVAHDLRSPLMAISGMAHAISDGVVHDDATREEYLRSICDKADKMGGLVSSVFDYAKLGGGSFVLEREVIELPELLLREAAVAYSDVEDAGMHLSVEVPEDSCQVLADPVQLGRVVANLLVNAVRHNSAGTEVALLLVRQAGVAFVVVADTGDPISGDPEELFQPFVCGDAARSAAGGSGLGLSICRRIAELHGYDLALVQPYGRFAKAFVLRCAVV
ncbi:MAG: HAMP domain-containing histidine kinase [Atopobiaceae bacterium]|nr:HAMP domain-containing histidine kinase [Atopobiaceae bacterium]